MLYDLHVAGMVVLTAQAYAAIFERRCGKHEVEQDNGW
jgi:hypothetical protein